MFESTTISCTPRTLAVWSGSTLGIWMLLGLVTAVSAARISVIEFELNDLTLNPDIAMETRRSATLRPLLVEVLTADGRHQVPDNPPRAANEAAKGHGYLFDRPALAAEIGRDSGADWVVSGRLHKASFLFVYLKAQLINAQSGRVAADFVVEIKGPQQKLTRKGIESLAQQIDTALTTLESR